MPNIAAWVDTGFLVALFARDDEHFASAVEFLANAQRLELHSLWWVVAEASCFLDIPGKVALLDWLGGCARFLRIPVIGRPTLRAVVALNTAWLTRC